ncbi:MAG: energy-coupling factor transporter transmembrane component T [Microbacterium sp.]|uniref:energy-coupling factor transporter transmembrane component T n=1 Tax=Microbacterium sp. TaxID=51671 RepID=UPI0039E3BB78
MLTLYRAGDGWLHRLPAGRKLLFVVLLVLAVSLLPSTWQAAAVAAGVTVTAYAVADLRDGALGMRVLGRQVYALRWILAITVVSQLIFLGPEPTVANSARVLAAIALAGLLVLTTRVTVLLDVLERALGPLRRVGVDPQRAALMLTVSLTTVPVLARLATQVRDAQRARGTRGRVRASAMAFLVLALKHADQLGDALTARGVR